MESSPKYLKESSSPLPAAPETDGASGEVVEENLQKDLETNEIVFVDEDDLEDNIILSTN